MPEIATNNKTKNTNKKTTTAIHTWDKENEFETQSIYISFEIIVVRLINILMKLHFGNYPKMNLNKKSKYIIRCLKLIKTCISHC